MKKLLTRERLPQQSEAYELDLRRVLAELERELVAKINELVVESNAHGVTLADHETRLDALEALGWDDLRFPAQAINPVGGTSDATRDTTETDVPGSLLFSGSQDNMVAGIAQMPHRWKRGTAIVPHIHWSKPTGSSSAVTWELYLRELKNPGEVQGAWSTAYTGSIVAGDQTVSDSHLISTFGSVAMTDREESAILAWRLYRRGSTDADANAVRLLEFDIHYQSDKPHGTATEIPA